MAVLEAWRAGLAAEYGRLDEDELARRLSGRVDLSGPLDVLAAAAERDMTELSDDGLLSAACDLEAARRVLDATSLAVLGAPGHTRHLERAARPAHLRRGCGRDRSGQRCRPCPGPARHRASGSGCPRSPTRWHRVESANNMLGALVTALTNRRVTELLLPMVPDLIADAEELSFDLWRAKLIALVSVLDADGPEPEDPGADNTVSFTRRLDGRWVLRGEFDAVTGAVIRDALTARADSLFHARRRDEDLAPGDLLTPSHRRLMAQALHDMARADRAAPAQGCGSGAGDDLPPRCSRSQSPRRRRRHPDR